MNCKKIEENEENVRIGTVISSPFWNHNHEHHFNDNISESIQKIKLKQDHIQNTEERSLNDSREI